MSPRESRCTNGDEILRPHQRSVRTPISSEASLIFPGLSRRLRPANLTQARCDVAQVGSCVDYADDLTNRHAAVREGTVSRNDRGTLVTSWAFDALGLLEAFALGVVASYVVWYMIARFYLPKLSISLIARGATPSVDRGLKYNYRVKVYNNRRRAAVDLTINCRLVIRGLNPEHPTNSTSLYLPIGDGRPFPVLDPRRGRIFTAHLSDLQGGGFHRLPREVRNRLKSGHVSMEELLHLGTSAFLRLAVTSAHEMGGLRRTYTRKYGLSEIVQGPFKTFHGVDIDYDEEQPDPTWRPYSSFPEPIFPNRDGEGEQADSEEE